MEEKHVKEWRESARANSSAVDFDGFWNGLLSGLRKYVDFLCSNPANLVLDFEDLVNEAYNHPTAKPAQMKIHMFYKWMLNQPAGDYVLKESKVKKTTAKQTAYSKIRGFYSHNGVRFPKRFKAPVDDNEFSVATSDRDLKVIIYDQDDKPVIDHEGIFQPFFKRLRFRDQVICACQMSGGGNDLVDLFKLTIGQVRAERNYSRDRLNFLWTDTRAKTGKRFKCPMSSSATKLLKDYVKQERSKANDSDLVFIKRKEKTGRILTPNAVANNYKKALYIALSITNKKTEYNPLRPKRFRHIFTTITVKRANKLGISPNMIRLWQGHAPNIQDGYVENDWESILRDYRKIEEYFQVFEVVRTDTDKLVEKLTVENLEMKEKMEGLEDLVKELRRDMTVLGNWARPALRRAFTDDSEEE